MMGKRSYFAILERVAVVIFTGKRTCGKRNECKIFYIRQKLSTQYGAGGYSFVYKIQVPTPLN